MALSCLPRDSVQRDAAGAHIFQAQDGKAKRVEVSVVGGNDTESVVEGTLDPAIPVVIQGAYQLREGMALRFPASTSAAANDTPAKR